MENMTQVIDESLERLSDLVDSIEREEDRSDWEDQVVAVESLRETIGSFGPPRSLVITSHEELERRSSSLERDD